MAIAREAEPVGSLTEIREAGLGREDLLEIYWNMLLTRGIEERGHILYKQGKIPGSFYTGRGNEASSVGVATAMGSEDVGTPLHRDMGVQVTRGVEPWRIFPLLLDLGSAHHRAQHRCDLGARHIRARAGQSLSPGQGGRRSRARPFPPL